MGKMSAIGVAVILLLTVPVSAQKIRDGGVFSALEVISPLPSFGLGFSFLTPELFTTITWSPWGRWLNLTVGSSTKDLFFAGGMTIVAREIKATAAGPWIGLGISIQPLLWLPPDSLLQPHLYGILRINQLTLNFSMGAIFRF